jgi:phospholipid/cholesterol/gamma-HCH transport system substrate-binding protein
MNFKISKEFQIGVLVIVTIAITFFGINYLKGINIFNPTNYYYLKYDRINGLVETNPVNVKGYKVGLVQEIIYDYENPNKDIIVVLQLDEELRIPVGTKAALVSGLMGGATIELMLNESSSYYERGDTIPGYIDDGIMTALTSEVMPRIQTIIPQLDSLIVSLNEIAENKTIESSLANINEMTGNLKKASVGINRIVDKDVPELCTNMNSVLSDFSKVSGNLSKVDFDKTVTQLNTTLSGVQTMVDRVNRGEGTLGLLMKDSGLYNNLNTTVSSANELLVDLKANPKRYVHFSVFGGKKEGKEVDN